MCPTHGKESLLTPYERRRMMMEVAEVAFLDSLRLDVQYKSV